MKHTLIQREKKVSIERSEMMSVRPRTNIETIRAYIPGKPIEEVARELNLKKVIKLASNENPLGPSPKAQLVLKKNLDQAALYPDDSCFYLKKKLAATFKTKADSIIIGNGSVELILLACLAYLEPTDELMMSEHAFIMPKICAQLMGAKVKEIPLFDYTHDLDRMIESITPQTKIIYLDNPINPVGTIAKKEPFAKFIARVPNNILVIVDEAYYEYIISKDYPDTFKYLHAKKKKPSAEPAGPNILILRTFSKIYGLAGLRIGYGFSAPTVIANLQKVRMPFNANRLAQQAAIAALDDRAHIARSRRINEAGKNFLYKELKALKIFFLPSHTNFVFVNFVVDSSIVYEKLLEQGIITRMVKEYGWPNALRITIGTREENELLIEGLKSVVGNLRR